jgi:integrase/recombinase XerD
MESGLQRYLRQYYAAGTVREYSRDIEAYLLHQSGAEQAMYKDITAYIGALRSRYSNASTIRGAVCAIKAYYSYLCHTGMRKDNPAKAIRLKDRRNSDVQLQDLFSTEELEAMLERKEPYYKWGYRNKVLVGLLIYQALWPQEMAAVRVADIDLTAATVYIRATRNTNARTLPLKANQVLLFYEYIHAIRQNLIKQGTTTDKLLIGLQGRALPAWAISVHIKRCYGAMYPGRTVCPHTIRQSVITNLLKAGHDISVVQLFAGHVCAASTQRYQQSGVDSLKAAVHRYHPMK